MRFEKMKQIIKSLRHINWRLFTALLVMGLCPTVYTTVRTFFLGQMPGEYAYSIAGQLSWVNLIYEIVNEAIILPLFFFVGKVVDDKKEFIERKLVNIKQCVVIPGIGVDTDYFAFKPIKNTNTFLMIARMMPAKGIIEYCEAARIVKKTHPEAIFNYIGEEFTLTKKDIQEYIDDGSINYLGYIEDVRPSVV